MVWNTYGTASVLNFGEFCSWGAKLPPNKFLTPFYLLGVIASATLWIQLFQDCFHFIHPIHTFFVIAMQQSIRESLFLNVQLIESQR